MIKFRSSLITKKDVNEQPVWLWAEAHEQDDRSFSIRVIEKSLRKYPSKGFIGRWFLKALRQGPVSKEVSSDYPLNTIVPGIRTAMSAILALESQWMGQGLKYEEFGQHAFPDSYKKFGRDDTRYTELPHHWAYTMCFHAFFPELIPENVKGRIRVEFYGAWLRHQGLGICARERPEIVWQARECEAVTHHYRRLGIVKSELG